MRMRLSSVASLALVSIVGLAAFFWPFFADPSIGSEHGQDAPWLFALLMALLAVVLLGQLSSGGIDAKAIAVLGVLAAAGGALRVLSAGTAGLEPVFFLLVVGGRVLGAGKAFLLGALTLLAGAFLTSGVGPWLPFQMFAAGWVSLGAAVLPRVPVRWERWMLAGYGAAASLLYGMVMNLWFWPFLAPAGAPSGAAFGPGEPLTENLHHYAVFYVLTSLGYDVPRAVLTAVLTVLFGPRVMAVLRRGMRRASFDATPDFQPPAPVSESGSARTGA